MKYGEEWLMWKKMSTMTEWRCPEKRWRWLSEVTCHKFTILSSPPEACSSGSDGSSGSGG